ncbi:MAG TPA: FliM/FliN family flagellar motor switch protein [Pirellulaceae bacterium]|nr:FliM/FliN family flagellar motor switch protein [Pirellulaceae bacterium]
MADFGSEIRENVAAACRTNGGEIGAVLSRALDAEIAIEIADGTEAAWGAWPDAWSGGGLVIAWQVDERFALLLIPQSTGFVPDWVKAPDPTGQSRLDTLALELGMNALPDDCLPVDSRAAWVDSIAEGLGRASGDSLGQVDWQLTASDKSGSATLIFPVRDALAIFAKPASAPPTASEATAAPDATAAPESPRVPSSEPASAAPSRPASPAKGASRTTGGAAEPTYADPHERLEHELHRLPEYVRSLLRVEVEVSVTLATTKTTVARVVEIGPGAIIQFDKSCEAPLTLEVAGVEVALGEAVKIGDKFGLRVDSIRLPPERFFRVPGKRSA